jgi:LuxR family maltose regulon positive regulatory protein
VLSLRRDLNLGAAGRELDDDRLVAIAELSVHSPWRAPAILLRGIGVLLASDKVAGEAILGEAAEAAARSGARYAGVVAHAERALLALSRDDLQAAEAELAAARSFAEGEAAGDYVVTVIMHAASAKLALAQRKGTRAREDLARAHVVRPMVTHALSWLAVQSLIELARIDLALGDGNGARTLVLEMDDVLHRRPDVGTLAHEAQELRAELAAFTEEASGWASTLTAAELRLLPLLTTHLSFREIAERLLVSRNTVKTQAISVYRKLDATSRSEAMARAVELGLVDEAAAARRVDMRVAESALGEA